MVQEQKRWIKNGINKKSYYKRKKEKKTEKEMHDKMDEEEKEDYIQQ